MPEAYMLSRDEVESRRLELQHNVYTKSLGYVVNPRIAANLPDNARVADMGTGTAIWLVDLAKIHPNWRLEGYDLSDAQYPPAEKLPRNVSLHLADVKQPFPEPLRGQFDLIHLRLLMCAMDPDEWVPALANVKTLPKPGGWIQWEEMKPDPTTVGIRGGPATDDSKQFPLQINRALVYLRTMGPSESRAGQGNRYLLSAVQADSTLKEVLTDVVSSDRLPELRAESSQGCMGVLLAMGKQRLAVGGEGAWSLEELHRTWEGILQEIKEGAYVTFYIQAIIART